MTATLDNDFNWRSKGVCTTGKYDMHFADVEDLIEFEGMDRPDAEHFAALAEETAKAACARCPVRDMCRDWALANEEDWGIWGAMTPPERKAHRPQWLAMKGQEMTEAVVQHDQDALHANAGVSALLAKRNEGARVSRDWLLQRPADWSTPKTSKDKARSRDEYLMVCELVLANPTATSEEIGARQGLSREWATHILRKVRVVMEQERKQA